MSNRTVTTHPHPGNPQPPVLSRNASPFAPVTPIQRGSEPVIPTPPSRNITPIRRGRTQSGYFSLRRIQDLAARLFPHSNAKVACPPGPIPSGPLPPLIVSSLMRSGTHLAIDLLLNNIEGYRQSPLFVDFDAYVYEGFSAGPLLTTAGSCVVKTHFIQRPFSPEPGGILGKLADRGVVIIPVRRPEKIQRSMMNWGYQADEGALENLHRQHLAFWKDHDPVLVEFDHLLDPVKAAGFLATVRDRAGLPAVPSGTVPFVAGSSRPKNLWRKLRTRLQADRAPRINTSVGFKL